MHIFFWGGDGGVLLFSFSLSFIHEELVIGSYNKKYEYSCENINANQKKNWGETGMGGGGGRRKKVTWKEKQVTFHRNIFSVSRRLSQSLC